MKRKKRGLLVLLLVAVLAISPLVSTINGEENHTAKLMKRSESANDFTHKVLAEYGSMSTCPHCPPASSQLYDIYTSGDYDFYYVSLVYDKNSKTGKRLQELGISGVPDVYFDGKYTHVLGEQSNDQAYRNAITSCGARDVADIDLEVTVVWKGDAVLEITAVVQSNEIEEYNGHLRAYIVEPVSRWDDQRGNPYHFGFLDFAFDRSLSLKDNKAKPLGDTYEFTTTWRGLPHGFSDITKDNIMVIAAVFNKATDYVDQTTAAVPTQYENDGQISTSVFNGNGYTNITPEEAWEMLQCPCDGLQIPVDVRTIQEFIEERIDTPSFYNRPRIFPLQLLQRWEFMLRFFMWQYSDQEIIIYCRSGNRSFTAVKNLVENNFNGKICHMVGGIKAWKAAGLPTVKGFGFGE